MRGSSAHFLLGVEMEGDPPGNENVEGGALTSVLADLCSNINDSNKCQSSSPIDVAAGDNNVQVDINFAVEPTAVVDDAQLDDDYLAAGDVESAAAVDVTQLVEDVLAAVDVDIAVDGVQDFEATAPVDEDQVEHDLAVDKHLPVKSRKKMPKRKHKFGKGAKRGGDRKSSWPVD